MTRLLEAVADLIERSDPQQVWSALVTCCMFGAITLLTVVFFLVGHH